MDCRRDGIRARGPEEVGSETEIGRLILGTGSAAVVEISNLGGVGEGADDVEAADGRFGAGDFGGS